MIEGTFNFKDITRVVETEYNTYWKGTSTTGKGSVKESKNISVLSKYWTNLGISNWSAGGTPWSAAYVSWIMGQIDSTFPKSSAHRRYAKKGLDNRNAKKSGYRLYSLNRETQKIKCQLGDVLVAPRGKPAKKGQTEYLYSHADVVYKIDGNIAYLAGGNLSDTNRTQMKVTLNADGSYNGLVKIPWKSKGHYLVVLKRVD